MTPYLHAASGKLVMEPICILLFFFHTKNKKPTLIFACTMLFLNKNQFDFTTVVNSFIFPQGKHRRWLYWNLLNIFPMTIITSSRRASPLLSCTVALLGHLLLGSQILPKSTKYNMFTKISEHIVCTV